jgi:hypothetical protein
MVKKKLFRNGHEQSVRTQLMKTVFPMLDPRLRASPRHGGQEVFLIF